MEEIAIEGARPELRLREWSYPRAKLTWSIGVDGGALKFVGNLRKSDLGCKMRMWRLRRSYVFTFARCKESHYEYQLAEEGGMGEERKPWQRGPRCGRRRLREA